MGKEKAHFLLASPVLTGFPPISMEMPKNEICNIRGINFCFTGTFWPTLYGHSYINRGTQRRFPPKCIKNTFWATQSTFRSLEMLSKRRFEIYICSVILGHFESFRNFQGFSIIFPAKLLIASHAGVFRGARFSSLPTNTCSAEDNIPFPCLANHIVLSKLWKLDFDRKVI